jgi:hypothetical protein
MGTDRTDPGGLSNSRLDRGLFIEVSLFLPSFSLTKVNTSLRRSMVAEDMRERIAEASLFAETPRSGGDTTDDSRNPPI